MSLRARLLRHLTRLLKRCSAMLAHFGGAADWLAVEIVDALAVLVWSSGTAKVDLNGFGANEPAASAAIYAL